MTASLRQKQIRLAVSGDTKGNAAVFIWLAKTLCAQKEPEQVDEHRQTSGVVFDLPEPEPKAWEINESQAKIYVAMRQILGVR